MNDSCPKIIVVEDDPDIRFLLVEILESDGFQVKAYANGLEAMSGLRECQDPCLIFLDLMMPVMSGHEFLKARGHLGDRVEQIPVVIVSAVTDHASRSLTGLSGVAGSLKKPVDIEQLLRTAHRFCDDCTTRKSA